MFFVKAFFAGLIITIASLFQTAEATPIVMLKTTTAGTVARIVDIKLAMSNAVVTHDVPFYNWEHGFGSFITAPWGSWEGYIATPNSNPPAGALEHVIQFEFRSENFFVEQNTGHFVVGLRSRIDGNKLNSNGIILGNVSEYYNPETLCGPADKRNAASMAVFFTGGNCVLGSQTTSVALKDKTDYFVIFVAGEYRQKVAKNADGYLRYFLMEKVADQWVVVDQKSYDIPLVNFAPSSFRIMPHGGWFIAENLSQHYWQFKIKDLKAYWVVE